MNNLTNIGKLIAIQGNELTFELMDELNIERLKHVYEDYEGEWKAEIFFKDPRAFTVQQRAFTFALLNDIYKHTGQPLESLKDVFYWQFRYFTGKTISLSNGSLNTVDDVATLDNLILDFIFENHIPFRDGYEIPKQNIQYYFYKCLTTRTCCICGKPADICHVDTVGAGRNRRKIDHSEHRFYAGCRVHHSEEHTIGTQQFLNKYQIIPTKLDLEASRRLNIGG